MSAPVPLEPEPATAVDRILAPYRARGAQP
jgi:hypothetical protein